MVGYHWPDILPASRPGFVNVQLVFGENGHDAHSINHGKGNHPVVGHELAEGILSNNESAGLTTEYSATNGEPGLLGSPWVVDEKWEGAGTCKPLWLCEV